MRTDSARCSFLSLGKHLPPSVQSIVQHHKPSTTTSDSRSTVSPNELLHLRRLFSLRACHQPTRQPVFPHRSHARIAQFGIEIDIPSQISTHWPHRFV